MDRMMEEYRENFSSPIGVSTHFHVKMCVTTKYNSNLFFEWLWVHFGIPQTITLDQYGKFLNTIWSVSLLWLLDTKFTKYVVFHPQTHGKTKVFNHMIVHILLMYKSRHPHTWDGILPYVQHSYKKALHNSTAHSPFQVGLGFQPLGPIEVALPLAMTYE
jgi:hypothetical protein